MDSHVDEGLTFRQNAFVTHFISPETFGNGTQSARLARFAGDDNTLAVTASRLLRNNKVQKAIQKRLAPIMDAEECLEELTTLARVKPSKDGAVNTNHKIKTLELVGKAHNLFGDKADNPLESLSKVLSQLGFNEQQDQTDNSDAIEVNEDGDVVYQLVDEADLRLTEGES